MAEFRPSLSALYNQAVSDILTSNLPGIENGLLPDSVLSLLAWNQALMANGQYGYIDACLRQCTPFTATDSYLYAWGGLKTISLKLATVSIGTASGVGLAGSDVPLGTVLLRQDGFQYITTQDAVVNLAGTFSVPFQSIATGAAGNISVLPYNGSINLYSQSPVNNVSSEFTVSTDIVSGSDQETDDSFRTRTLAAFAQPSQGGSTADYIAWLEAVPGVSRAWVSVTNSPFPGSVVCYVMFDDADIAQAGFPQGTDGVATAEGRLAVKATGDQLNVANNVFPLKPAVDVMIVSSPLAYPVVYNFDTITPDTTDNRNAISAALSNLFLARGTPLGVTISTAVQYAAITSISTLSDFSFSIPIGNIVVPPGYLPILTPPIYGV